MFSNENGVVVDVVVEVVSSQLGRVAAGGGMLERRFEGCAVGVVGLVLLGNAVV